MTDEPTEYDAHDYDWLVEEMGDIPDDATSFEVDGDIEWSGEFAPSPRRTLRAGGQGYQALDLDKLRAAKAVADAARAVLLTTPPRAASYRATGWQAQWSKLQSHGKGAIAQAAAGLNVSPRTVRRWAQGTQAPSKANRERIDAAYEWLATTKAREASGRASAANKAVGDALSEALKDRYGAPVRIFRAGPFEWS